MKYVIGFVIGIGISIIFCNFVQVRESIYHVEFGKPLTISDYVQCNESISIDGITFLVSPNTDGYKVMISRRASASQARLVLDAVYSFLRLRAAERI